VTASVEHSFFDPSLKEKIDHFREGHRLWEWSASHEQVVILCTDGDGAAIAFWVLERLETKKMNTTMMNGMMMMMMMMMMSMVMVHVHMHALSLAYFRSRRPLCAYPFPGGLPDVFFLFLGLRGSKEGRTTSKRRIDT